ncbi:unnamed protein product [Trichobilharzia szidati]|nr:unnamed protein product [Trichobilharzia szidati]
MSELFGRLSITSDDDDRFRRQSMIPTKPLLANTPAIQKLQLKHLPNVDAKRIISLLDNLTTRILLVSSFPQIVDKLQEYSLILGRNATVLFEAYSPLSKICNEPFNTSTVITRPKYFETETTGNDTKKAVGSQLEELTPGVTSEDPLITPKRNTQRVISRLYDVTRLLLRDLMANPLAVSALIRHREQWAIEPSSSCRKLVNLLVHLRTLTRNELLTTQKAKIKRDDFLDRLHRKDLEQTKQIEILTETYNQLKSTQLSQTTDRMDQIKELKSKIQQVQKETQDRLAGFKQDYNMSQWTAYKKHQESVQTLKMFLEDAKNQLNELTKKSVQHEHKLRSEKWKIEDVIYSGIFKKDTDLFEMQVQYDEYFEENEVERLACQQLRAKVEPLKALADVVLEERRLEAEKKAAEIAEKENRRKAATTIQSLWRSWKARKTIKAQRKKKGNKYAFI